MLAPEQVCKITQHSMEFRNQGGHNMWEPVILAEAAKLHRISNMCMAFCLLAVCLLTNACRGDIAYQPPLIPIRVSVDINGNVDISTGYSVMTPIGTFTAGLYINPSEYFKLPATLTIRLNGEDKIYRLDGKDFDIQLESAYYERIKLEKKGENILLELRRVQSFSQPDTILKVREFLLQNDVEVLSIYFEVGDGKKMLIVSYTTRVEANSDKFILIQRTITLGLSSLLSQTETKSDGLVIISSSNDVLQNYIAITTEAIQLWESNLLSDQEFEDTWFIEKSDQLQCPEKKCPEVIGKEIADLWL